MLQYVRYMRSQIFRGWNWEKLTLGTRQRKIPVFTLGKKTVRIIYLSELHTHMFLLFPPITIVWD